MVQKIVGYVGEVIWDENKPNGTPQKLLDISKLNNLGWKKKVDLQTGIEKVFKKYIKYLNYV